jgi:hypothetical protein
MRSKGKEEVKISERLQSSMKTIKNAEKQIEQDEGSLKLLQKIQGTEMVVNQIDDKDRLDKLIDYGMVNRLINNEVVISGIGLQILREFSKQYD